ncbi:hypothetical protein [Caulobacter sp. DWR1-3-2b1]|uniref:hypothetical protein n=1 Tax=Caulobacter sp. DWR1-3-2b1 TaxID=2804670 RepID=UPI003CEBC1F7
MVGKPLSLVPSTAQVAEIYDLGRGPETTAQRVKRLQAEARMLAREEVERLDRGMIDLAAFAAEIAAGGDAYPAGIREMASRIAADLPQKAQGLRSLVSRNY